MPIVASRTEAPNITDGIIQIDLPDITAESGWKSYYIKLEDYAGGITSVETYADFASLPGSGTANILYITLDDYSSYVWDNSQYNQLAGGTGSASFIGLTDVPASYADSALYLVRVNATNTALEFIDPAALGLLPDLSGTGDRMVEASSAGVISATKQIVNGKLTDGTAIALLVSTANWSIDGAYTGAEITGTYEGQYYRNDEYFFFAYADNDWIRTLRG